LKSKSGRCYTYTGLEKDGYFYPIHVAAENGHKELLHQMIKIGCDINVKDYRGDTAESKCTGDSIHAFYEHRGLRYQSTTRCERLQGSLIGEE
jgi:hypothetical protein